MNSPYSLTGLPPDLSVCPAVCLPAGAALRDRGEPSSSPAAHPTMLRRSRYRCPSLGKLRTRRFPQRLPLRAPSPPRSHPRLLAAALPQFPAGSEAVIAPGYPGGSSLAPAEPSRHPRHSPGSMRDTAPSHGCIPAPRAPGIAPRLSEDFPSVWDKTKPCQS